MRRSPSDNFIDLFTALVVLTLVGPLLAATLGERGIPTQDGRSA